MIERLLGDNVESSGRYLAEVIYGANDGIITTSRSSLALLVPR
ncbi:MAG: hypothetical protein ACLFR6_01855 [Salinarchaeum sp.]